MANKQQLALPDFPTLGYRLREAREALGFAEEDIADHLRIDRNMVSKIENDQLKDDDLTVFVRGYIRAYAKHVNFPADEVDAYFIKLGVLKPNLQLSPTKFEFKGNNKLHPRKARWITFTVITCLILAVLAWVFFQRPDTVEFFNQKSVTTPAAPAVTTPTPASVAIPSTAAPVIMHEISNTPTPVAQVPSEPAANH